MANAIKQLLGGLLDQTRSAGNQLRSGLSSIRDRIRQLHDQKAEIEALPCDKATALDRVDALVRQWAGGAKEHRPVPAPERFTASPSHLHSFDLVDRDATMFAYLAPLLADAMKAEVAALYATTKGVTETERAAQLAKVDRELLDAEMAEESIIRAAEASGFPVQRRGNADPRAVLAHDKALP